MRPQEFVVVCVFCGEVIALKMGGERVPEALHFCAEHDGLDAEIAEQEEERIKGGGKGKWD